MIIRINAIDELLVALEIVHGRECAGLYRDLIRAYFNDCIARFENCDGAGI